RRGGRRAAPGGPGAWGRPAPGTSRSIFANCSLHNRPVVEPLGYIWKDGPGQGLLSRAGSLSGAPLWRKARSCYRSSWSVFAPMASEDLSDAMEPALATGEILRDDDGARPDIS